ncbi:hypothetical protein HG531_009744 [Fusarium graminearum]|nr:hypothetical protein HG531_009744 [Fusarium graminearum]
MVAVVEPLGPTAEQLGYTAPRMNFLLQWDPKWEDRLEAELLPMAGRGCKDSNVSNGLHELVHGRASSSLNSAAQRHMLRSQWGLEIVEGLMRILCMEGLLRPGGSENATIVDRRDLRIVGIGNLGSCSTKDNDKAVRSARHNGLQFNRRCQLWRWTTAFPARSWGVTTNWLWRWGNPKALELVVRDSPDVSPAEKTPSCISTSGSAFMEEPEHRLEVELERESAAVSASLTAGGHQAFTRSGLVGAWAAGVVVAEVMGRFLTPDSHVAILCIDCQLSVGDTFFVFEVFWSSWISGPETQMSAARGSRSTGGNLNLGDKCSNMWYRGSRGEREKSLRTWGAAKARPASS